MSEIDDHLETRKKIAANEREARHADLMHLMDGGDRMIAQQAAMAGVKIAKMAAVLPDAADPTRPQAGPEEP